MWGVGKKSYRKAIISRKRFVPRYRNPKVFTRKLQSSKPKIKLNIHLSRRGLGNIVIILIIIVLLYIAFFSSYFQVSEVITEGNKIISSDSLKSAIPVGSNIFRLSTSKIKANISNNNPEIKQLAVFKGLPNAIKIQVVERQAALVWVTNDKKYLVDADGIAYKEATDDQAKDIIKISDSLNRQVNLYDTIIPISFIRNVQNFYNHFKEVSNLNITGMSIGETSYDLTATTDANISVIIDTTQNPDITLADLQKILVNYRDKIKEYIDLRVEGWGYYK